MSTKPSLKSRCCADGSCVLNGADRHKLVATASSRYENRKREYGSYHPCYPGTTVPVRVLTSAKEPGMCRSCYRLRTMLPSHSLTIDLHIFTNDQLERLGHVRPLTLSGGSRREANEHNSSCPGSLTRQVVNKHFGENGTVNPISGTFRRRFWAS